MARSGSDRNVEPTRSLTFRLTPAALRGTVLPEVWSSLRLPEVRGRRAEPLIATSSTSMTFANEPYAAGRRLQLENRKAQHRRIRMDEENEQFEQFRLGLGSHLGRIDVATRHIGERIAIAKDATEIAVDLLLIGPQSTSSCTDREVGREGLARQRSRLHAAHHLSRSRRAHVRGLPRDE